MTAAWEKMGKTPIEFMVWLKFPYEIMNQPRPLGLKFLNPRIRDTDFFRRASEYRDALKRIPEHELLILVEEEARIFDEENGYSDARALLVNQKAAQFYDQPEAEADFEAWARTPFWSLDEALALSFGKEPGVVNWETIKDLVSVSDFAKRFKSRRRIFTRAELSNALQAVTSPRLFLAWAEQTGLQIPDALVNAIMTHSVYVPDWKTRHDQIQEKEKLLQEQVISLQEHILDLEREMEQHQNRIAELEEKQKHPDKRSLQSFLKIILGMAVVFKGHHPFVRSQSKVKAIHDALTMNGVSIDEETLRRHLASASKIFPEIKPME